MRARKGTLFSRSLLESWLQQEKNVMLAFRSAFSHLKPMSGIATMHSPDRKASRLTRLMDDSIEIFTSPPSVMDLTRNPPLKHPYLFVAFRCQQHRFIPTLESDVFSDLFRSCRRHSSISNKSVGVRQTLERVEWAQTEFSSESRLPNLVGASRRTNCAGKARGMDTDRDGCGSFGMEILPLF